MGSGLREQKMLPIDIWPDPCAWSTRFQLRSFGDPAFEGKYRDIISKTGITRPLNTHTSMFRYVSAGHPGPLQVRTDGKSVLHPQEGFAIGWFPDSTYQEFVIELKPGDRLYLYSDGILEAMNSEDELFGPERVVEALEERKNLTLQGGVEELVECRRQWSGDAGFADDVSILALERRVAETP